MDVKDLKHAHHGCKTKVYNNVSRFAYVPAVVQQNSIVEVTGSKPCLQENNKLSS